MYWFACPPVTLAHTSLFASCKLNTLFGVFVQPPAPSPAKIPMPGLSALTVNTGGLPTMDESGGETLPIVAFQVSAVGAANWKNCGFVVIVPPFVWFNCESIQFM